MRLVSLGMALFAAALAIAWLLSEDEASPSAKQAMPPPHSAEYLGGPVGESGGGARGDRGVPMIRNPDYVGKVIGDPRARVLIQRRTDDEERDVRVQFRNLRIVCEGGSRRVTPVPFPSSLSPDRAFESMFLFEPELGSTVLGFILVKGRLLSRGRARGLVFDLTEILDEPSGTRNADECWTDGVARWHAHRVRDRGDSRPMARSGPPARNRSAMPSSIERGRYEGTVLQQPPGKGSLTLRVNRRDDRTWVRLQSTVRLECDGPDEIETLGTFRIPLSDDRRFNRTFFKQHRRSKHRFFTWVKGRVSPSGKAKGVFFHFDDPWDPDGTANVAECGTPFGYRWRARRR